jgi:hypothetical protein
MSSNAKTNRNPDSGEEENVLSGLASIQLGADDRKGLFLSLLADLCKAIPEPARKVGRGRPAIPLTDSIFPACFKVYSGFSDRRFTCDLESAAEVGHITKAIHHNICCVISAIYERGIDPKFLGLPDDNGPRDMIRFPVR